MITRRLLCEELARVNSAINVVEKASLWLAFFVDVNICRKCDSNHVPILQCRKGPFFANGLLFGLPSTLNLILKATPMSGASA